MVCRARRKALPRPPGHEVALRQGGAGRRRDDRRRRHHARPARRGLERRAAAPWTSIRSAATARASGCSRSPTATASKPSTFRRKGRGTLCVSSQVGCALDCSFCSTGRQGFNRNLSVDEIVGQLWLAQRLLERDGGGARDQRGHDGHGRAAGELPGAGAGAQADARRRRRLRPEQAPRDGIDLGHGALDGPADRGRGRGARGVVARARRRALRDELVPINRKYPIEELMAACRRYADGERSKHVMFEYVMLDRRQRRPGAGAPPGGADRRLRLRREDKPDPVQPLPAVGLPEILARAHRALRENSRGPRHRDPQAHHGAATTSTRPAASWPATSRTAAGASCASSSRASGSAPR